MKSELGRYGGKNWLYRVGYGNASPTLQINDAGYLQQANYHAAFALLTWRTTTCCMCAPHSDITRNAVPGDSAAALAAPSLASCSVAYHWRKVLGFLAITR